MSECNFVAMQLLLLSCGLLLHAWPRPACYCLLLPQDFDLQLRLAHMGTSHLMFYR